MGAYSTLRSTVPRTSAEFLSSLSFLAHSLECISIPQASERAVTVAEEASALQEMREALMQMLAIKGGEGWPAESAHAHHINRVLEMIGGSEPGRDVVLPRAQSAELRQIFEALPREELLDSEIFTPVGTASSTPVFLGCKLSSHIRVAAFVLQETRPCA